MESPTVVFEDENLLAINKPGGMAIHPHSTKIESTSPTVLDWLLIHFAWAKDMQNPYKLSETETINLSGIVHRLDRDTSGIVVIAKSQKILDELFTLFRNHQVTKEYVAVVHGNITQPQTIDIALGREKKGFKRAQEGVDSRGPYMEAHTELTPINHTEDYSLVKLTPKTGRTHQLRAHMTLIGHPIVGDILYGKDEMPPLYLHAQSISFTLDGERYHFEAKLPEYFNSFVIENNTESSHSQG
jgi:23S rRNA pseudouridine1911/1915/1917 synthase